jgi:hypothetical protein
VVTAPVATPVATVDFLGHSANLPNWPPLGQTQSGWRDLNSRPLDPQSSALPSCATARFLVNKGFRDPSGDLDRLEFHGNFTLPQRERLRERWHG